MDTKDPQRDGPIGASTPADRGGAAVELPPVWLRLPDLSPAASGSDTASARNHAGLGRRRFWHAGPVVRPTTTVLAVGATVVIGIALLWLLPGLTGSKRPAGQDSAPPSWEASSSKAPWRKERPQVAPPVPPTTPATNHADQTAGPPRTTSPTDVPDSVSRRDRLPGRAAVAEFEGTIRVDPQRRARYERNGSSLY